MQYQGRRIVIIFIFLLVGLVFILRLVSIQLLNQDYSKQALRLTEKKRIIKPARGLIYDRNGKLLVANITAYDLVVYPDEVENLDTLALLELAEIDRGFFIEKMEKIKSRKRKNSPEPSVFIPELSERLLGKIIEKIDQFLGFEIEIRSLRSYPVNSAAHILGYIGEVNDKQLENDPYYRTGDYTGISGLELSYEKYLRGKKGMEFYLVDRKNTQQGILIDTPAVSGADIKLTIDIELQTYCERLMQNKMGSIVAIDPRNGEILSMVTSPEYNPQLLVGKARKENYPKLITDSLRPLFNRATNGMYRPGSIFKLVQSLVGMEMGIIKPNTRIRCNRNIIKCHGSHTYDDLTGAIQHSCNPYFHEVYKRMIQVGKADNIFDDSKIGIENWNKKIKAFGFGTDLGVDFYGLKKGRIPNAEYYDKKYGSGKWTFSTIYSNSIGEGELGVTPIQMANLAAIIANRGHYYPPHFAKEITSNTGSTEMKFDKKSVNIQPEYFQVVIEAMQKVIEAPDGTATLARINEVEVCGKTGTVQNKNQKDHSVFIAFAPKENPQIAIAVYVEFSGFGGEWAAPISSLIIEKHLKDSITDSYKEQRILKADFIH